MSDRLHIAFDVASIGQGGMERQLIDLAAGLSQRDHEVLLVVNKHVSAYRDAIDSAGVRVAELGRQRRSDMRVVGDIAHELRQHKSDVVVGVNFNATALARLAARRVGIPAVTAEHSIRPRRRLVTALANRMLASSTAAVVACANAQVPMLVAQGNPRDRIVVVRNGVDPERFAPSRADGAAFRASLGIGEDAFVVGLVAAHRPEKRHDRFFEAIERATAEGVDCYGLSVGGGPLLERNRGRANASSAADRLRVVGPRDDLPAVYSACDACVLCSDSDTFPLTLMEAQACGVPVVAMNVGGVAETFEPGSSGVLVAQGDLGGMVDALVALASEPTLARGMGSAGRAWVRECRSIERMVDGYLDVLRGSVPSGAQAR